MIRLDQLPDDDATLTWCLDYILHTSERESYFSLPNLARKREWLAGRLAAKEAVRRLAQRQAKRLYPADIIINRQENGQPYASGIWATNITWSPVISISHKDNLAIAVAGSRSDCKSIGVDIEVLSVKDEGFEELAFSQQEREALQQLQGTARDLRLTQMWCAKEAAGKALGIGLSANPRSLKAELRHGDQENAQFAVRTADGARFFIVNCYSLRDMVCALTVLQNVHADSPL